jgi:hypothetical protein
MIGKLYQEALLDLEEIKKVVEEDAKKKIYDQLTPRIKSLIEKKLFEEEVSEEEENGNLLKGSAYEDEDEEEDDLEETEELEEEEELKEAYAEAMQTDAGGANIAFEYTGKSSSDVQDPLNKIGIYELKSICSDIIQETQLASSKRPSYRQLKETLKKIDFARKMVVKHGGKLNENMVNSYVNILENCFNKLTGNKLLNEVDIVLRGLDEKLLTSGDIVYEVDFSDPYESFNLNSNISDDFDDEDGDYIDIHHDDKETINRRRFSHHHDDLDSYDDEEFDEDDDFDSGEEFDDHDHEIEIELDNKTNKLQNENFGRMTMRKRNLNESAYRRMMEQLEEEMAVGEVELDEDELEEGLYEMDEDAELEENEMMEVDEEDLQEALEELEMEEGDMEEGYHHEADLEEEDLDEMMLELSLNEEEEESEEVEEEEAPEEMSPEDMSPEDMVEKLKELGYEVTPPEEGDAEPEPASADDEDDEDDEDDGDAEPEPASADDEDKVSESKLQLESKFNRYKKLYMESKSGSRQEAQYLNILKGIATKLSKKNTLSERSQNRRSTTSVSSNERKLQSKLEESNLLNAKLLYTNKLLQNPSLTNRQKAKLVEKIDESRSLREVKLVFESVQRLTSESTRLTENRSRVLGSSSMSTAGSSSSAGLVTESFESQRWAKLAGIK